MAKSSSSKTVILVMALVVAAIPAMTGLKTYKTLTQKAADQRAETERVNRWKSSVQALGSTITEWQTTYRPASSVPDLYTLASYLGITESGLSADTDNITIAKDESIKSNGIELGLTKLCLANGNQGFVVKAFSYDALLDGINHLAHRKDIYLDNIAIVSDNGSPQANIGDLCVYVRNE